MSTTETRRESYKAVKPTLGAKQLSVLKVFESNPSGLTAWEAFDIIRKFEQDNGWAIYTLRPRITELFEMGKLEECGRRWHEGTKRNETVFRVKLNVDESGQMVFA